MLGDQFRNTYWRDDASVDHQYTDTGHRSPTHTVSVDWEGDGRVVDSASSIYGSPHLTTAPTTPREHQGLLFHPLTGTGRKGDPTVSPDTRRQLITERFQLDPTSKEYVRNHAVLSGSSKLPSKSKLTKYAGMAMDAIDSSGLTTQEIRNRPRPPGVSINTSFQGTRNADGLYNERSHVAASKVHTRTTLHRSVERVATEGGDLIPNPKPIDPEKWYLPGISREFNGLGEDVTGNFEPPEAHEHLWMGKGKPNDKYVSERVWTIPPGTEVTDHTGQTRKHYGSGYNAWGRENWTEDKPLYVRKRATAWEEKEVITKKTTESVSPSTVLHEIGHGYHGTQDHSVNSHDLGRWADPLYEGVADGFSERNTTHANSFPETLSTRTPPKGDNSISPGDLRVAEIKNGGQNGGYGSNHSQWANPTERALYVAMRQHTAVTGEVPRSNERRATLRQVRGEVPSFANRSSLEDANRLVLGRMYDEHPHVREAVDSLGFQEVGSSARAHYRAASGITHREDRDRGTQLKLF